MMDVCKKSCDICGSGKIVLRTFIDVVRDKAHIRNIPSGWCVICLLPLCITGLFCSCTTVTS